MRKNDSIDVENPPFFLPHPLPPLVLLLSPLPPPQICAGATRQVSTFGFGRPCSKPAHNCSKETVSTKNSSSFHTNSNKQYISSFLWSRLFLGYMTSASSGRKLGVQEQTQKGGHETVVIKRPGAALRKQVRSLGGGCSSFAAKGLLINYYELL